MTAVVVALCGSGVDDSLLRRSLKALRQYGFEFNIEAVCSTPELISCYEDLLPFEVRVFDEKLIKGAECVLYLESGDRRRIGPGTHLLDSQIAFSFSWQGRLVPLNDKSRALINVTDAHHFSRASQGQDRFYYFPYGYLYRDNSVGKVNAMGFRVPEDLSEIEGRDRDAVKLVCIFGGSAAFSMNCLESEMFSACLERMLNQHVSGSGTAYRVLNFGMHGHVVLNEMITYMLFVDRLQPDIVIAHDGFNDLAYGCNSDKYLLEKHSVACQENLELWALLLADREADLDAHSKGFYKVTNFPKRIVESYLQRKSQFRRIVESIGCAFVSGFQPFLSQKSELTKWEKEVCLGWMRRNPMRPYFERMDYVFEKYLEMRERFGFSNDMDFREVLDEKGGESVFADFVHMRPEGDLMIAEAYFNHIRDHFIGNGD